MKILPFVSQFLFCWIHLCAAVTPIPDKAKLPLLTPSFAERQTAKLQLDNGLQVYIISDPYVDKSSAALVVKTGSWEDPVDAPGIAHFLEHMLFLGNEKYPHETEYDHFMTSQGGKFNAFTSNDITGYVFSIDNSAFAEALDRFSNFFKTPLFNPSGVDRELQAIDQEYAKNVENDDARVCFVRKVLTTPGHPNNSFNIGNRASLQHVSQETLKNWYYHHYSANRMIVEVISNHPLDELKKLVIENFNNIPNHNIPRFIPAFPVISEAVKGHMVYIDPIKNLRQLNLIWEVPPKFAAMRETKPELLICHVLNNEGPNSLASELKQEKLIEGMHCEMENTGGNSFTFQLQLNLTDSGVKQVNTVILRFFEAIDNFKQKGIPKYLVDELKTMTTLDYQYQVREDSFEHILKEAMRLADEDLSTYPEHTLTFQRYDAVATAELLEFLTPENALFELLAPQSLTGVPFENKEKWMNVPYTVKAIPEDVLTTWKHAAPHSKIDLPGLNPYLPLNIELLYKAATTKDKTFAIPHPATLINDDNGTIYFTQDTYYSMPTISWIFDIKTPTVDPSNLESVILGDLFVKYINEDLSPYTYPASLGGISINITPSDNGISIIVDGYNDKSRILFLDIIKEITQLQLRDKKFKIYKDLLLREYQNEAMNMPVIQAYEVLNSVLHKDFFVNKAKAAGIKKITFEQFQDFYQNFFKATYVEGMMYGNINVEQAQDLASQLIATLNSQPYPKKEQPKKEVIVLPENQGPFLIETKSKVQGNAAVLAIALGRSDLKERAAQQILMQAMKGPFFSTLRTKQQTGYIVRSSAEEIEQHLFDTFAVQSNTHEGRDLIARFELFIEGFLQELGKTEITQEQFETFKKTFLTMLRQPPQSMAELTALLNKLAFIYEGDFNRMDKRIQAFEELSYEEFLAISRQMLGKNNKHRIAIVLTGSTPEDNLKYKKLCNTTQLKELSTYEPAFQD